MPYNNKRNKVGFSSLQENPGLFVYIPMLDKEIPIEDEDFFHGTAVTSLIVDGASINPALDDGCGRFRVKHFGVAKKRQFSAFSILRSIRNAVSENPDIKVWNLSLGSAMEIHPNFISPGSGRACQDSM